MVPFPNPILPTHLSPLFHAQGTAPAWGKMDTPLWDCRTAQSLGPRAQRNCPHSHRNHHNHHNHRSAATYHIVLWFPWWFLGLIPSFHPTAGSMRTPNTSFGHDGLLLDVVWGVEPSIKWWGCLGGLDPHSASPFTHAGTKNSFQTLGMKLENITNPWSPEHQLVQPILEQTGYPRERQAAFRFGRTLPKYLLFTSPKENRWGHQRSYRLQIHSMAEQVLPPGWQEEQAVTWAR